jgi:TolB protein
MRLATYCPILTLALSLTLNSDVVDAQNPVGIFDARTDVGRVRNPGVTTYDRQLQAYTVAGSGQNMWNDRDDFHFVWKRISGNFILSTRAHFIGAGVEPHRKIGWTIRQSLETNSAHVTAALHGDGLTSLQFRRTAGAITEEAKSRDSLPNPDAVIQLERRDGAYLMSVARFGDTLVTRELSDVSLPDTVYVGLFVCAHNDTVVERAAFSNVRITIPTKKALVPYREYIGSNLEILDVASGNATIVHSYRGSFQAPNWTPDGKALIYAQEGLLYRFDLSSLTAAAINTGFATRNNNDHVLSFDGRMLGISHHAAEDSGVSIIYTLPATGGTPTRVTSKGPSYLHGWSPDAHWLVYTGIRGEELDVYKIPVTGGDEIRLTTAPGLDDGAEFTPDGAYIYFNSSRTGRMQIWRMRPDGTDQQQITNDGFNNWFPHVSPDGKRIVYIAFPPPPDVAATDHPFYKHVTLRLMPIGGGPARVIAYVYGGQGTMNVPSWSPDGTRLAFVSNSTMP